jgi:ribonuclease BN (tRNA processing enzyme)
MFGLRVVQAEFGDCLVLEFADNPRRFILIDGGPDPTYERHLKSVLTEIANGGGKLDMVVLSHVDGDHIEGLIEFFTDLRDTAGPHYITVGGLWMNTFSDSPEGTGLEAKIRALGAQAPAAMAAATVLTIGQGNDLTIKAAQIGVKVNDVFPDKLVLVDTAPSPVPFDGLEVRVVGPTQANLDALRAEWEKWIEKHQDAINANDPLLMANSDRSIPNLSSIALYVKQDTATMLLTGDGRSDHLLDGLNAAGLLAGGKMHVSLLKLAHHGSDRDVTKAFFHKVTADKYVVSANGKDDNPDIATLIWLVEAAKEDGRPITIYATNETPSIEKLRSEYDPAEYGYTLELLSSGDSSMLVEV